MQDFATEIEWSKGIEFGERCVQAVPDDIEASVLASRYHLLGTTYALADRPADSVIGLHKAADLYLQVEKYKSTAGVCLIQAALQAEEIGDFDQARTDLERCLKLPGTIPAYWLAEHRLSLLLLNTTDDLGAAIESAERALRISISGYMNLTVRAMSSMLSARLYLHAGDAYSALNRAELLIQLQSEDLSTCFLSPHSLFDYTVHPPPMNAGPMFAYSASLELGRIDEAKRYAEYTESLANEDSDWNSLPEFLEVTLDEQNEFNALLTPYKLYYKGEQLLIVSPQEAISYFEDAASHLLTNGDMRLVAQVLHELGVAYLFLTDADSAEAKFHQALEILATHPNPRLEFSCQARLGDIAFTLQKHNEAYSHWQKTLGYVESERRSIHKMGQLELFAGRQEIQNTYKHFIQTCLRLGYSKEALEATEKVKSRILLDLLSQEQWKPIDYRQLDQLETLNTDREEWYRKHILYYRDIDFWGEDPMLTSIISHDNTKSDIVDKLHETRRFLLFELQELPLGYEALRDICCVT